MPGPPRTPPMVRLLLGNPGKRPIHSWEFGPHTPEPECPSFLGPDARAEWMRLAPALRKLCLLSALYKAAFAMYCASHGRAERAMRSLQSEERAEAAATDDAVRARHRANIEYLAPIVRRETKDATRGLRQFQLSPRQRESLIEDPDTYAELSLDQMKEWVARHFALREASK